MGSAFAMPLADNGHDVRLVGTSTRCAQDHDHGHVGGSAQERPEADDPSDVAQWASVPALRLPRLPPPGSSAWSEASVGDDGRHWHPEATLHFMGEIGVEP